jgi:hypothetical protein
VTGNLVAAGFTHYLARPVGGEPDPHLHSHNFIFNVTWDPEEKCWKAGEFSALMLDKPYFEACFHTRLAAGMRSLGFDIERKGVWWDVAGLPDATLDKFSRRTKEIEAEAKRLGLTGNAKDKLGARTRNRKGGSLNMDQLRSLWRNRMNAADHRAIADVLEGSRNNVGQGSMRFKGTVRDRIQPNVHESLTYGMAKLFQTHSVMDGRALMTEAMRYGVGFVSPEDAEAYRNMPGVMTVEEGERVLVTTRDVLAEETKMLNYARDGRGKCMPLGLGKKYQTRILNAGQEKAVQHVLESWDRVMLVLGYEGAGKTTAIMEAAQEIEKRSGHMVFTFAPSATASRDNLAAAGFGEANTVEHLLRNEKLQDRIKGQVIWIDEGSMVGVRDMNRVFDLAEQLDCRVILSGDTKQHGPVARGDAMRILDLYAGCKLARITEIMCQTGAYKEAAKDLEEGRPVEGFDKLERMGWVNEVPDEVRPLLVAQDYLWALNARKSALVVAPTHIEGERIAGCIRDLLKKDGKLGSDERQVYRLRNLHWSDAEKADPAMYHSE